jgi:hypothetical protein
VIQSSLEAIDVDGLARAMRCLPDDATNRYNFDRTSRMLDRVLRLTAKLLKVDPVPNKIVLGDALKRALKNWLSARICAFETALPRLMLVSLHWPDL